MQLAIEAFTSDLRYQYNSYSALVEQLNGIGPLDAPLSEGETIAQRARDVGEVARLEFLIDALLRPAPALKSAA
jgi:hypothetical protein